jgi:AmmeMemoRadiSam system protein B/AmmeMemoRadiSam system protein A
MKQNARPILLLFITLGVVALSNTYGAHAEPVRKPVWAGRFYPSQFSELSAVISRLTTKAQKTRLQIPRNKALKAIVMPHAGYIYSGWTAAHVSRVLHAHQFSKVILLGPDHSIGFRNGAICDATAYETPLGRVNLHKDTIRLSRQHELFQSLPVSYDREHSLEVILPFLQSYLEKFELVPVIVGKADTKLLSNALDTILDNDTLLVISSDLSHFLAYPAAVDRDRETIAEIVSLKSEKLIKAENRACGKEPMLILMELARRHRWYPLLLHYSNSGDTAGDHSRVVGYAAIAFFGDLSMEKNDSKARFNEKQGQLLVKLARQTIMKELTGKASEAWADSTIPDLQADGFQANCGTFVTLKIHGKLRGCIGNLTANESVLEGIKRNAVNAAFNDPRFSPLTAAELDQTEIEVSILTEPFPLEYRDGQDLLGKLRVNVDGVIIRKGHRSATFLPQVWEQLPRPEDFLSHLCMKAGISSDAWKGSGLEVLTYQVQYFEEKP